MADWSSLKIFFPGPTWVCPDVRAAMSAQVLHHRTPEYRSLHARVVAGLRRLLYTDGPVFLVNASGTGLMEAAARNLVRDRVLCLANGAFGERLHKIAIANGKAADLLAFEWGRKLDLKQVQAALAGGRYDTLMMVHNETSTGVMNPLPDLAEILRHHPEVVWAVDAVSSLGGVRIDRRELGIDFLFAGVQKCLALPPGMSVAAVSERALERARSVPARGLYFDLLAYAEAAENDETPATPSVPHVAALDVQLARIEREGIEARFLRHRQMAERTRAWARERMGLYAEEGSFSDTVTAIANPGGVDLKQLLLGLREHGFVAASGYGSLKARTFRIGHMGDLQLADVEELLATLDQVLSKLGSGA